MQLFFLVGVTPQTPIDNRKQNSKKGGVLNRGKSNQRSAKRNVFYDGRIRSHSRNFSMYARKMCIDGYVIKRDFAELKALTKELANLARNINQIALRANETRSIYEQDIKDLQRYYYNVKRACTERLVKMIRE